MSPEVIGTSGAATLGEPVCLAIGGSAAISIVGIPILSISLCTITAERWQVPHPAVNRTPSTPAAFKLLAISGPVFSVSLEISPPPPINPMFISDTSFINSSS